MKKLTLFVLMFSLILAFLGCGLFKSAQPAKEIAPKLDKTTEITSEEIPLEPERITEETPQVVKLSSLCTDPPELTDIGRMVYPVDPKYVLLDFLGELFTAYNCGPERVSNIFGVDGEDYTIGSTIWLKNKPSQSLINTFNELGFTCEEGVPDKECIQWELWDTVKVEDMMKLEPFYQEFEDDDCTNCG